MWSVWTEAALAASAAVTAAAVTGLAVAAGRELRRVVDRLERIERTCRQTVDSAERLIRDARRALNDARAIMRDAERKLEQLDALTQAASEFGRVAGQTLEAAERTARSIVRTLRRPSCEPAADMPPSANSLRSASFGRGAAVAGWRGEDTRTLAEDESAGRKTPADRAATAFRFWYERAWEAFSGRVIGTGEAKGADRREG